MSAERLTGLVLVAVGGFLLLVTRAPVGGEVIPLLVGVGFFVAYALTRGYGLLVPAGILTGLGVGIVVAAQGGPDGSVLLGLGAGFLAITVVDRVVHGRREAQWWPLIPGGILALLGTLRLTADTGVAGYVLPVLLVLAGLALLLPRRRGGIRQADGEEKG